MRAETVVNARRRQRRGWVGNEVAWEVSCGGESEGEKKTCRAPGIRAISRVTNLYGIVWFIGRKFNNGRPNNPPGWRVWVAAAGRKGREELPADGKIYDAFVWVSASRAKSLSTIFQRDIRCTNRRFMTRIAVHSKILVDCRARKWNARFEKKRIF